MFSNLRLKAHTGAAHESVALRFAGYKFLLGGNPMNNLINCAIKSFEKPLKIR